MKNGASRGPAWALDGGRRVVVALCCLLPGLSAGCGDEAAAPLRTVSDSAGVRVVTYGAGWADAVPAWELAPEPTWEIGAVDGAEAYLFTRLTGIVPTDAGVIVADLQSRQIREFDGQGRWVRSVGRRGAGPGEFVNLDFMGRMAGDTLVVWDGGQWRLSYLAPDLSFGRSERWDFNNRVRGVYGVFPDGSLLKPARPSDDAGSRPRGVVTRSDMAFVSVHGSFIEEDTLAVVPGRPVFLASDGQSVLVPFAVFPGSTVSGDAAWLGSGHTGVFARVVPGTGRTVEVRLPASGAPVSAADFDAYKRDYLVDTDEDRRPAVRRRLDELPAPERFPVFDVLRPGHEGQVWMRSYPLPGDSAVDWFAFTPDGEAIGRVTLPVSLAVQMVHENRLIATTRDELGVVRVVEYMLQEG